MAPSSTASLGFKIVDQDSHEVWPLLECAEQERRPLEVGLYYKDVCVRDMLVDWRKGGDRRVNTHLDHRRLSVYSHRHNASLLREQMEFSLAIGAAYAVNHIAAYPMSPRPAYREALVDRLTDDLTHLNVLCGEYGLPIHIENTFHALPFYRQIFNIIQGHGLSQLHFCFDIGHAKVWSSQPLSEWVAFMEELEEVGIRIHFHLHANSGLMDEHLPLMEAECQGHTGPDDFTGRWDFHEAIAQLDERFPAARKVFEVPTGKALGNLRHVESRIDAIRAAIQSGANAS